ncbi:hypothetical protein ABPG74_018440 [Tetrahymena malaccensis]
MINNTPKLIIEVTLSQFNILIDLQIVAIFKNQKACIKGLENLYDQNKKSEVYNYFVSINIFQDKKGTNKSFLMIYNQTNDSQAYPKFEERNSISIFNFYLNISKLLVPNKVKVESQMKYEMKEDIRKSCKMKYNSHSFSKSRNASFEMTLKLKMRGRKFRSTQQKASIEFQAILAEQLEGNNPLNQKLSYQNKRKNHLIIDYIKQYQKYAEYLVDRSQKQN